MSIDRAKPEPSPIVGKTLKLSDSLFKDDAIILDRLASTSVRFAGDHGPSIEMSWEGFPQLGVWSNGAPFLCIEPWQGFASPVEFDGEFADKPGVMHFGPGERRFGPEGRPGERPPEPPPRPGDRPPFDGERRGRGPEGPRPEDRP